MKFRKKDTPKTDGFVRVRTDQDYWNFFFTLVFVTVFLFLIVFVSRGGEAVPVSMPVFDAVLIALAAFRLTRLFVYDKITEFIRNVFLVKNLKEKKNGEQVTELLKPENGPRKTISHLFGCPWCTSVWVSAGLVFFYFFTPYAWIVIFVLAVSAVASVLQIFANFLGWHAEAKKQTVKHSEESQK